MRETETRPRFSEKEDAIIIKEVSKNPQNLAEAFRTAQSKLPGTRSIRGINQRWYNHLNRQAYSFMTIGSESYSINKKCSKPGYSTEKPHKGKIRRILDIIFNKDKEEEKNNKKMYKRLYKKHKPYNKKVQQEAQHLKNDL